MSSERGGRSWTKGRRAEGQSSSDRALDDWLKSQCPHRRLKGGARRGLHLEQRVSDLLAVLLAIFRDHQTLALDHLATFRQPIQRAAGNFQVSEQRSRLDLIVANGRDPECLPRLA